MKWYMTPDLWVIAIAGLVLVGASWFAPRKWVRSGWLGLLCALGVIAWAFWSPVEYVQNVSVDNDNNVVVVAEVLSRDWAHRSLYSLRADLFSNSGRHIRTHSIKLPSGDYHGVSALKPDAEGNIFMGLTPDRGGQPLLAKASSDGRVLWMVNTASPVYDIKITGFRVETIETSSNETRLTYEWFDSEGGRPMAEWSWAFPLWRIGEPKQVCLDASGGFSANAGDLDNPVLVKLTPAGQTVWNTPVQDLTPLVLCSDARGNHYLAGRNGVCASITKLGPEGGHLWFKEVLHSEWGMRASISNVASDGESVFVYGVRSRPVAGVVQKSYERRAFIARLSPSGTLEWRQILKGNAGGYAPDSTCFAVDRSGSTYVADDRPWSGKKIALTQYDSAGRLKWKALAPDRSLMLVILATLALVIQMVKAKREKRAAQGPPHGSLLPSRPVK